MGYRIATDNGMLNTRGGQTVLEVTVALNRRRFVVGTGPWVDASMIGATMTVRVHFILQPVIPNPAH